MIIFLTYDIKNHSKSFIISFIFDILCSIMTFSVHHSVLFHGNGKSDVIIEIQHSDVTFNVAYELSQPMGKTEFSSTAKNRTNSV